MNITLPKAILPCQKQYYPGKININLGEGNPRMPQPIREQHLFLALLIWQKTPYLAKDPKGVPQNLSFVNKPFRCNARIVKTANLSQKEAMNQFGSNFNGFLRSKSCGNKKKFVKIGQRKADV